MKFIRDRSEFEHTLITMHNEGWSIRELQRQFQLGRNTVRRILRAQSDRRNSGHDVLKKKQKRASKLDSFEPEIKRLLEKYPLITGVRIYEELKDAGYAQGPFGVASTHCTIKIEIGTVQQRPFISSPAYGIVGSALLILDFSGQHGASDNPLLLKNFYIIFI